MSVKGIGLVGIMGLVLWGCASATGPTTEEKSSFEGAALWGTFCRTPTGTCSTELVQRLGDICNCGSAVGYVVEHEDVPPSEVSNLCRTPTGVCEDPLPQPIGGACNCGSAGGYIIDPVELETMHADDEPNETASCEDTCRWAGDGACDDGGEGASFSVCDFGTDCSDCGPR